MGLMERKDENHFSGDHTAFAFGTHVKRLKARAQMSGITYHNVWYRAEVTMVSNDPLTKNQIKKIKDALRRMLRREYNIDKYKETATDKERTVRPSDLDKILDKTMASYLWGAQSHNQTWQRLRRELEQEGIRFKEIIMHSPTEGTVEPIMLKRVFW